MRLDGIRQPGWGALSGVETYYPYRAAIGWLNSNHAGRRVLVTGMDYPYYSAGYYFASDVDFTEESLDNPRSEAVDAELFAQARARDFGLILFQLQDGVLPAGGSARGYRLEKVVRNSAESLAIYAR